MGNLINKICNNLNLQHSNNPFLLNRTNFREFKLGQESNVLLTKIFKETKMLDFVIGLDNITSILELWQVIYLNQHQVITWHPQTVTTKTLHHMMLKSDSRSTPANNKSWKPKDSRTMTET